EALRRLAARCHIEIAPVLPESVSTACDALPAASHPLLHMLRMLAADSNQSEIASIDTFHIDDDIIARFALHLDPILDPGSPRLFSLTRSLWRFLEWLDPPGLGGDRQQEFRRCWEQLPHSCDGGPIDRWRHRYRGLAHDLARAADAIQVL